MSHRKSSAGHICQQLSKLNRKESKKESSLTFFVNRWDEKKRYQCTAIE